MREMRRHDTALERDETRQDETRGAARWSSAQAETASRWLEWLDRWLGRIGGVELAELGAGVGGGGASALASIGGAGRAG
jgi:hypothetical protein